MKNKNDDQISNQANIINEGIYQTNASRNGIRSGSTNTNATAILGPFVPGEIISVQFSAQGLYVVENCDL